ncbi:MAG TPA: urea carboxylase-associated family protein [Streptosporangiaceae bacterium]|nr:urea carboxylase-associated family protein [Streptosporangiaceae bacterium]
MMPEADMVEDVVLAPRQPVAMELRAGHVLRVTDTEGQQVGDLIAFALRDMAEKLWVSNTIRLNKTVYLTTGHVLYSELSRPMLTIIQDTCGRHDLLAGSCNAEIDAVRYGVDGHRGCVENFLSVLRRYGLERKDIPMSFNLFMNCPIGSDGRWEIAGPTSNAGDHIDLRAEMDLLVALSNCPQDLNPCNAATLTPLRCTVYRPEGR